jgi:hypothetical protein
MDRKKHDQLRIKIALTSKNKAKIEATNKVFTSIFKNIEISTLCSNMDFIETPLTDEIALELCRKRIDNIQNQATYDFIVSLEGMISKSSYGCFVYGWVIIKDCKKNYEAIGCSAKVQVPDKIATIVSSNQKISSIIHKYYSEDEIRSFENTGLNGLITKGMFTRVNEFESAIYCALGYLNNILNYQ